jgi:hypothetical protein
MNIQLRKERRDYGQHRFFQAEFNVKNYAKDLGLWTLQYKNAQTSQIWY